MVRQQTKPWGLTITDVKEHIIYFKKGTEEEKIIATLKFIDRIFQDDHVKIIHEDGSVSNTRYRILLEDFDIIYGAKKTDEGFRTYTIGRKVETYPGNFEGENFTQTVQYFKEDEDGSGIGSYAPFPGAKPYKMSYKTILKEPVIGYVYLIDKVEYFTERILKNTLSPLDVIILIDDTIDYIDYKIRHNLYREKFNFKKLLFSDAPQEFRIEVKDI